MSQMEEDAERVADLACQLFARAGHKHSGGYPGGTTAFLAAHVDSSIAAAAKTLGVTGAALLWAQDKFIPKAQAFFADPSGFKTSSTTPHEPASHPKWWQFWR